MTFCTGVLFFIFKVGWWYKRLPYHTSADDDVLYVRTYSFRALLHAAAPFFRAETSFRALCAAKALFRAARFATGSILSCISSMAIISAILSIVVSIVRQLKDY